MKADEELLRRLVYLDRGYVADRFEVVTETSSNTQITRAQGKKAGADIPFFSAELSATETRSFSVSTFQMLSKVLPDLENEPVLVPSLFRDGMLSEVGWVIGELSTFSAETEARSSGKPAFFETYFMIRRKPDLDLALITTPEYFYYGLNALARMHSDVSKRLTIPVKAYVRTLSGLTHIDQWIAVPLVILEGSLA